MCDVALDASASEDPKDEDLTFTWRCYAGDAATPADAVAECDKLAQLTQSAILNIPGDSLPGGDYKFVVNASRSDAWATTEAIMTMDQNSGPIPVVSLPVLPQEQSKMRKLDVETSILESGGCAAPPWKAWWLLREDAATGRRLQAGGGRKLEASNETVEPGPALLMGESTTEVSLYLTAPLPVVYGERYLLRLILSMEPGQAWQSPSVANVFHFDTPFFRIDEPPRGGAAFLVPSEGEPIMTLFSIKTDNWVDDDLPLKYRFAWQQKDADTWTFLSGFTQKNFQDNTMFPSTMTITVRADAQDNLGSWDSAVVEGEIVKASAPPSNDALLGALDNVLSSGDPTATLNAAMAIAASASTSTGEAPEPNPELANALLGSVADSPLLEEPSSEGLSSMNNMLGGVIGMAAAPAPAAPPPPPPADGSPPPPPPKKPKKPKVDPDLANKAGGMLQSMASACATMDEGVSADLASGLVGSVGSLLTTVDVATDGRRLAADSAAVAKATELSGKLTSSMSSIGDAALKAVPEGRPVVVDDGDGLKMDMMAQDASDMNDGGADVGNFKLPSLGGAVAAAQTGAACGAKKKKERSGVGMQQTKWASNPYGFASSKSESKTDSLVTRVSGNGTGGEAPTVTGSECCDVDTDNVVSMDVRMCGEKIEVHDLAEPIVFQIAVARRQDDTATQQELRVCQYFNEETKSWSDEGCWVLNQTDTVLWCACSHLSAFGGGFGVVGLAFSAIADAIEAALKCSNAKVLSSKSMSNLVVGMWWARAPALFVEVSLFSFFMMMVAAYYHDQRVRHEKGWTDDMFIEVDESVGKKKRGSVAGLYAMLGDMFDFQTTGDVRRHSVTSDGGDIDSKRELEIIQAERRLRKESIAQDEGAGAMSMVANACVQKYTMGKMGVSIKTLKRVSKKQRTKTQEDEAQEPDEDAEVIEDPHEQMLRQKKNKVKKFEEKLAKPVTSHVQNSMHFRAISFGGIVATYFMAVQPLLTIGHFCLVRGSAMSLMFFIVRFYGGLMASALFFESTGQATSADAPEECQQKSDFWAAFVMNIVIAGLSSFISVIPIFIIGLMETRGFTKARASEVSKKLWKWYILDVISWFLLVGLMVFYILFLFSFMANTAPDGTAKWFTTALFQAIKQQFLVPILVSIGLALVSALLPKKATGKAVKKLGLDKLVDGVKGRQPEEEAAAEESEDGNAEAEDAGQLEATLDVEPDSPVVEEVKRKIVIGFEEQVVLENSVVGEDTQAEDMFVPMNSTPDPADPENPVAEVAQASPQASARGPARLLFENTQPSGSWRYTANQAFRPPSPVVAGQAVESASPSSNPANLIAGNAIFQEELESPAVDFLTQVEAVVVNEQVFHNPQTNVWQEQLARSYMEDNPNRPTRPAMSSPRTTANDVGSLVNNPNILVEHQRQTTQVARRAEQEAVARQRSFSPPPRASRRDQEESFAKLCMETRRSAEILHHSPRSSQQVDAADQHAGPATTEARRRTEQLMNEAHKATHTLVDEMQLPAQWNAEESWQLYRMASAEPAATSSRSLREPENGGEAPPDPGFQ
eukprot:TRINITY_DN7548_c0_g2_i1.p1 TRINITY_DN7548_c0_g2~~TRINITY_DN7548_c0_g2_i1.p1  ORF type:complete len:1552 (-),score=368.45 TRINITY_DN7548_c0_g2_i1:127-4782(-)